MSDKLLYEALEAAARERPNSVVGDLLMMFPLEVATKVLVVFSGETVRFPKIESVWSAYRNCIIKNTLDRCNNRVAREQLAAFFGISSKRVSGIYHRECHRRVAIDAGSVRRTAKRLYKGKLEQLVKSMKEAVFR